MFIEVVETTKSTPGKWKKYFFATGLVSSGLAILDQFTSYWNIFLSASS